MKAVNFVTTAVWIAFLTGMSAAGLKYVAVVETDVDAASGASADINPAEVREITAELRRQATEHLPPGRYSVMTSETVQSMGGAVLEECAEENCVIALGSRIGADYIVRGTISKFQTRFTLAVEMYETDNGTLVVSSEAVRSENLEELLNKAAGACANMFKKFVDAQAAAQKPTAAVAEAPEPKSIERQPIKLSAGGGALFASDFGGGLTWERSGEALAMPYYGGGLYLFFDAVYAEAFVGFSAGGGKWESPANTTGDLPDVSRFCVNIGAFAKYPVNAGNIKLFPLLGIDYEASMSDNRKYDDGREITPDESTSATWFKIGGGADLNISGAAYARIELLYGWRTANECENTLRDKYKEQYPDQGGVQTMSGNGLTLKAGVGVKF